MRFFRRRSGSGAFYLGEYDENDILVRELRNGSDPRDIEDYGGVPLEEDLRDYELEELI